MVRSGGTAEGPWGRGANGSGAVSLRPSLRTGNSEVGETFDSQDPGQTRLRTAQTVPRVLPGFVLFCVTRSKAWPQAIPRPIRLRPSPKAAYAAPPLLLLVPARNSFSFILLSLLSLLSVFYLLHPLRCYFHYDYRNRFPF